jgi:hypothetical protein
LVRTSAKINYPPPVSVGRPQFQQQKAFQSLKGNPNNKKDNGITVHFHKECNVNRKCTDIVVRLSGTESRPAEGRIFHFKIKENSETCCSAQN